MAGNLLKNFREQRLVQGLRARILRPWRPKEKTVWQLTYRGATFCVLANETVGWHLISRGAFEGMELDCLELLVRSDDVCVDIGANIGIYSVLLGRLCPRGRVYACEPLPLNQVLTQLNAQLNGLSNVEMVSCAVADKDGEAELSVAADGAFSSIIDTKRSEAVGRIEVEVRSLDSLTSERFGRIDVLKIDVEGAEAAVLRGAGVVLGGQAHRPRVVIVELNEENLAAHGAKVSEVVNMLDDLGYVAYSATAQGLRQGWPIPGGTENAFFLSHEM